LGGRGGRGAYLEERYEVMKQERRIEAAVSHV
jgi:hypothetical protein